MHYRQHEITLTTICITVERNRLKIRIFDAAKDCTAPFE